MPAVRLFSVIFIEFVRGVPLITVLFMASVMLPLFVPDTWSPDKLLRALVGVSLFASAYMAEVVRAGLQAIPKGQYEAAMAVGLGYWQTMRLIILPQALKITIPNIVNTTIGLFKDTTLVFIVGIFDFLMTIEAARVDPNWATPVTSTTGYAFAAIFYLIFCYGMSRYARVRRGPPRGGRPALRETCRWHSKRAIRPQARAAEDRRRRRHGRRAQVVRRFPRAARHQPPRHQERAHRDLRAVGLRQVDHDPLHQPPGGAPAGPHHRRRHRTRQRPEEDRRGPPRRRHGVPAFQSVPAPHRAGEPDAGADLGAQAAQARGRGDRDALSAARQDPRAGRQISRASCPAASSSASPSRARSA